MEWISAQVRSPEVPGIYWVVFEANELCERTVGDCYFIDGWIMNSISMPDVIYWMARPKPPKE